jgi:hypothetical protein
VLERLADLTPYARAAGAKLALEPLHPMTCSLRSVISSLKTANDWCDALRAEDVFGIAIDTYAVWWDHDLERELARAGKRIINFHVDDWLSDTQDLRLDRGMMGDGLDRHPGHPPHGGSGRLRQLPRGRDLLATQLVEARSRRGDPHRQGTLPDLRFEARARRKCHSKIQNWS